MAIELRKAERRKAKLRIGVFGPTGSGKTMSALKVAHGMASWEKICVIDTENGSADLYSHMGGYNVITLAPPYEPEKYIEAIKAAERAGMEVIIIDSITHEWQGTGGMLEIADSMLPQYRDGRLIWTKITPRHNKFIDSILQSPAHMICCGRSKQETIMVESERGGRKVQIPEKVGLKAITREGFEYEMTVAFDISINHYATCTKDRTKGEDGLSLFQDKSSRILSEDVGRALKTWSEEGKADVVTLKRELMTELSRLGLHLPADANDKVVFVRDAIKRISGLDPSVDENWENIVATFKATTEAEAQEKMFGLKPPQEPPVAPPPAPPIEPPSLPSPDLAPTPPEEPPQANVEPPVGEGSAMDEAAYNRVFEDKIEPEKVVTMDVWIADANKCATADEAKAMLKYMDDIKERAVHIHMVRGILASKGLIKIEPTV